MKRRGFTLLEVLIALIVFSFGVLGLVALQAQAVRLSSDAQHRAAAAFLADQLLARMLISDRTTAASFQHRPSGVVCAPTGTDSANPVVTGWLNEVAVVLPNAASTQQQVIVTNAATGEVTVRLCWQQGNEAPRSLAVTNQVQWQP